jgi:uncharacterized protein YjbI with pentapeptide repeats
MDNEIIRLGQTKKRIEALNVNMSGSKFTDVNLAGSMFKDVNLKDTIIEDADLTGVRIGNVNLKGATLDGILIEDLLKAYNQGLTKSTPIG